MWNCNLMDIRQTDLMPFKDLFYIYLKSNNIEIIEAGLFDFNLKIEFIAFKEPKIIHIDSNVFDKLNNLNYLWLDSVNCIKQDVSGSHDDVLGLIKKIKQQCIDPEFNQLDQLLKKLEIESKASISSANLESTEKSIKNSKFSNFEGFKERLDVIKTATATATTTVYPVMQPKPAVTSTVEESITELTAKLNQLESSQCGTNESFISIISSNDKLESSLNVLKSSQSDIHTACNELKLSMSNLESKIKDVQDQLKDSMTTSINGIDGKVNDLMTCQNRSLIQIDTKINEIQAAHARSDSLDSLTTQFIEFRSKTELSQDEMRGSMSDIEASVSNIKASQNEFKSTLIKLKTSQNEVKIALDGLRFDNSGDKLEALEGHFMEFKNENFNKFDKIEQELASTRHKISMNFDDKIKGIEKRLMKKFEDILDEKLEKMLENILKLGKSGTK
ncbi:putative leucine-rich repeat-containing protein DDB_G0290503 isoform X2 [Chironomus tepperi]